MARQTATWKEVERRVAEALGWSTRRIARALGVSHPTVLNDLVTGKNLPVELPERIIGNDGKNRAARLAGGAAAVAVHGVVR